MEKDFYKILGLDLRATDAEIKKAYRLLAFQFHPDKNEGDKEAEEHFKEIQEAYDTLGHEEKRKQYNLKTSFNSCNSVYEKEKQVQHYFFAQADSDIVKLNEEIEITFSYSGHGRLFRKPSFNNFFLTGTPFVSFRNVVIEGVEVKETSLTYIISPLQDGELTIEEASIKINNKAFLTQPISILVKENKCLFAENRKSDGTPLKYLMNYETVTGSEKRRVQKNVTHTLLIPRSHYAYVYHRIGTGMKIFFCVWGFILGWKIEVIPLFTAAGGLLFGGVFCNLLYLIAGVKPKFRFAKKYSLVQSYLEKGYRSGTDTGSRFISSEKVYFITSLLF